jgi:hypothetical protein
VLRVVLEFLDGPAKEFRVDDITGIETEGTTLRLNAVFYSHEAQREFRENTFTRRLRSELKRAGCGRMDVILKSVWQAPPKYRLASFDHDAAAERVREGVRQRNENVDLICKTILDRFRDKYALFRVFMFVGEPIQVYLFFNTNEDVETCLKAGGIDEIEEVSRKAIELAGHGHGGKTHVTFKIDSDENVKRSYEGNYYLRMR